uniref:Uncharacterized protein n=1 Tax=Rangifer tarandus platyrhynchus TaxID=3082113 RepID=A0ACB0FII9_RANTA|nr:unnamed protein product [Rangifer tarandus platyrhynchus]
MFQLWKLVLLCGLLAGTSASLLDNIGKDVLRKLKSGLEEGLENLDSTLGTIFQLLKTDVTLPQESSTDEEAQEKTKDTKNLLEQLISGIFQAVNVLTGVNISNLHILDITLDATFENNTDVKIPITADITVKPPLLGEIVDLDLNVDLQTSVSIETGDETSDSKVVVGECTNDPESISLTVLHRRFGLLNDVVDIGVNLARRVVSSVVQDELCPRIHTIISSLNENLVKNLNDILQETAQQIVN